MQSREIRLASRPRGWPEPSNFELATVELAPPADGEALVRNLFLSVDPYMRGRMNAGPSYTAPYEVGRGLEGGAVGEVLESRAGGLAAGDVVLSSRGWRERFAAPAFELRKLDPQVRPLSLYLGVLGMPGLTAWAGLELAAVKAGDRFYVSAAAGAVGSTAGQLARERGAFVVGSAGSPEKVKLLLEELRFDRAFDHHEGHLRRRLAAAAPEGLDVYFDNVGGEHLEAALTAMRVHGRIVLCGAISRYNDEAPSPGPRNLALMIGKRITMTGLLVMDWTERTPEFLAEVRPLLATGKLQARETVVSGIEAMPQAFIDLLRGANVGKMVVKLG